jgi:hypothetical protein
MNLAYKIEQSTGKKLTPGGTVANVVLETPEFRRIRDLPRRDWGATDDVDELVEVLTNYLKTDQGTQKLRPAQAAALRELHDVGGLFAPIRVGGGKTLVSFLAATVCDAQRALLLVPAQLLEKTKNDLWAASKHWKIRPITIESYETLSRDRTGRILEGLRPDLIIADEAHRLKNTSAGCTKRLKNYLAGARKLDEHVRLVCMSGTITTRSLREYWHLLRWSLGNNAPLPADPMEFSGWAQALDEKVHPDSRWQPGALERLADNPKGKDALERARDAYASRLLSCPGVISTRGEVPEMSLYFRATELKAPPHLETLFSEMRRLWETPSGYPFEMPTQLWAHGRELQCGFYYEPDPRPPAEWMDRRRELSKMIRETLKHSRKFATPGDIIVAIKEGEFDDDGVYQRWLDIKHTFKWITTPYWVDDTALRYCADWLASGKVDKKLCWVEHQAAGHKLSEMTGIPYFGPEGCDISGNLVDNHVGPAIVSVQSCSTGRNLQYRHSQNLYMSPMSKNNWWEQSLGRTHRDEQPEDQVEAEVLMLCKEAYSSLIWAMKEAQYAHTTLKEPQKLLYCSRELPDSVESALGQQDLNWKEELEGV